MTDETRPGSYANKRFAFSLAIVPSLFPEAQSLSDSLPTPPR